ncbi:NUDIX hydrolase [Diaminobutyricimonas sp. TR449]|uniref:NUDIX hydrolase n=1 Tax=Diaminobutyricimonas sp. TR449 TaxID=2708076 RepID=UPI001422375D|nr:NUDIX hydrolase [Diaminobutyricimonas sp. TR449]
MASDGFTTRRAGADPAMRLAATVALLRDADAGLEVLLVERPNDRGAFAGAWVFPGGTVDAEDRLTTDEPVETVARRAAIREVREETGLVVGADDLALTALWTPHSSLPRRFRTWFYWTQAPDAEIVLATEELTAAAWVRPSDGLAKHGAGVLHLLPPTWVTLHALSQHGSVADALADARHTDPIEHTTRITNSAKGKLLLWHPDVAYLDDSLLDAPGPRHRLDIGQLPWLYERTGEASESHS